MPLPNCFTLLLGWNYDLALWICSGVVLVYVFKAA